MPGGSSHTEPEDDGPFRARLGPSEPWQVRCPDCTEALAERCYKERKAPLQAAKISWKIRSPKTFDHPDLLWIFVLELDDVNEDCKNEE